MDIETGKSQVLVVDDEKCIRLTLKEFLEDEGFEVMTANGVIEAKQFLAAVNFNVAVVDRVLSCGHNGIDLIEYIKETNPFCQTILITAYPTFESVTRTFWDETPNYLIKPVAREDICKAVKTASQTCIQVRHEKAVALKQNL